MCTNEYDWRKPNAPSATYHSTCLMEKPRQYLVSSVDAFLWLSRIACQERLTCIMEGLLVSVTWKQVIAGTGTIDSLNMVNDSGIKINPLFMSDNEMVLCMGSWFIWTTLTWVQLYRAFHLLHSYCLYFFCFKIFDISQYNGTRSRNVPGV